MSGIARDGADDAEFTTTGIDARDYERYAEVELEEGYVLLYDRTDENAWIKSDVAVATDEAA